LTVCNTSSFLTRPVQLIFSIFLQYHISQLYRYFWSTFRSVQVSAPYKAVFQMYKFTSYFLKFKYNLQVKRVFFLFRTSFAMAILDLTSRVHIGSFVIRLPKWMIYFAFSSCLFS
jgi:hypothetical protein